MPGLVPNSPIKRIEYVIRQYDGTKNQVILPDVIIIALYAFGRDRQAEELGSPPVFEHWSPFATEEEASHRAAYDHDYEVRSLVQWLRQILPEQHQWDFIVPWVAKELGRLNREFLLRRDDMAGWAAVYGHAVETLTHKTPAIAMWAAQNRIDLNRTSLTQALEAIRDFEVEIDVDDIPQGEIVYEFADGWTIQRLSPEELAVEGELMQHCVGDFGDEVEQGRSVIFSLRSPKGRPHVTMEWEPEYREPFLYSEGSWQPGQPYPWTSKQGQFIQIMGKQNASPLPKYRRYIQEFILNRFDGAPAALMQVYTPELGNLRFQGHITRGAHFELEKLSELGTDMDNFDFRNGTFVGCRWEGWSGGDWTGATLDHCVMTGEFVGSVLDRARMLKCTLVGKFTDCRFVGTHATELHVHPASWPGLRGPGGKIGSVFYNATMLAMQVDGNSVLGGVSFIDCDLRDAGWKDVVLQSVRFEDGEYGGMRWARVEVNDKLEGPASRLDRTDLSNVDVDFESWDTMWVMGRQENGTLRDGVRLPPAPPRPVED